MSEFKPGETIRFTETGQDFKVAAVLYDKIWAQQILADGSLAGPLTYDNHMFEKIPNFFEPGRTYRSRHSVGLVARFDCVRVDESQAPEYGAEQVAYGKIYYREFDNPDSYVWGVRRTYHREDWYVE